MEWVHHYDFFLFDFDGLLVDTEALHFKAYMTMLSNRGYQLDWSFAQYCMEAHQKSDRLKEVIYQIFPKLYEEEPRWLVLRAEKIRLYEEYLSSGSCSLMPGVEKLLISLKEAKKPSCVVTNSLRTQTEFFRHALAPLQVIDHWVTREEYTEAKPSPEGYNRAIALYGKGMKKIIGFEDTPRGIWSLQKTPALPVLIAGSMDKEVMASIGGDFCFYPSFEEVTEDSLLL